MRSLFPKIALAFLITYLSATGALYAYQRHLLYFPNGAQESPQQAGLPDSVHELIVRTDDGLFLHDWYQKPTSGKETIVYFHGNADCLASSTSIARAFLQQGYGVLLAEYRGYSGEAGNPTEQGLYNDARAAINALISAGTPQRDIVIVGHSLGTGVATQMAADFPDTKALVLLAPFLSVPDAAEDKYPIFPVHMLVKDSFDNAHKIAFLKQPIFIANGDKDNVISPEQGRTLFNLAKSQKFFHFMPGKGHSNFFDNTLFPPLTNWIRSLGNAVVPQKS